MTRGISYFCAPVALTLVLGAFLANCESQSQDASEVSALAMSKARLWQKSRMTTCFDGNLADKARQKQLEDTLTATLKEQFTPERTIIHFSGYKDCAVTSEPDLVIGLRQRFEVDGTDGISTHIGTSFQDFEATRAIAESLKIPAVLLSVEEIAGQAPTRFGHLLRYTLIHEVGHFIGLFHESAHPDSTCQGSDSAAYKFEIYPPQEALHAYQDYGRPYDPYSIMNNCARELLVNGTTRDPALRNGIPHGIGLSEGDLEIIKHLYSTP